MANFSIQSVVDSKSIAMSGFNSGSKANMRLAMRSESGADGASFSLDALNKLKDSAAKAAEGIMGTKVKGSVGDTAVEFNNANGKLKVGGTELKLGQGGFANALKDNISVEKTSTGFVVNNLTDNTSATFDTGGNITKTTTKKYFDKDGKELTSTDGNPPAGATKTKSETTLDITPGTQALTNALLINNTEKSVSVAGGAGGDNMIINRAAGASITGTSKGEKLFNLSAGAAALNGGGGNDAVYSVGLNAGASINMIGGSGDMAYVKLLGNMKGGSVKMTGDTALLDASGKTLNGVKVSGSATTSAVVANALTGDGSNIDMTGTAQAAVDLKKVNMGSVTMGTGSNSVFVDSVTGNSSTKAKITTAGEDTLRIKSTNNAEISQAGNKSSWMKLVSGMSNGTLTLGSGNNSIDAAKANFNKTSITQTGGTGGTALTAKNFNGSKDSKNTITLQGDGNTVSVSGTIQNVSMELGTGANTLTANKINNALIKAAAGDTVSNEEQTITVKGGASKMEYQGSDGDDTLSFGGAITDSSFNLGKGESTFTAVNAKGKAQNLTNVNLYAEGEKNTVKAGNMMARGATGGSSISLMGSSTVSLGNMGPSCSIGLGTGANTLDVGSITGGDGTAKSKWAFIFMGDQTTNTQTLNVRGATKNAHISFEFSSGNNVILNAAGPMSNTKLLLGNATSTVTVKNLKAKPKAQDQAMTNMTIIAGSNSSATIIAKSLSGTGNGSSTLTLGSGTNKLSLSGSLGQNTHVTLGTGSNTLDVASIKGTKKNGVNITVIDTDAPNTVSVTTLTTRKSGANYLNYTGSSNGDSLSFAGAVNNSTLDVGIGKNSLTAVKKNKQNQDVLQAMNNVTIIGGTAGSGDSSSMEMRVGALKGKSKLTLGGDNNVTLGSAAAGSTIDLGLGASTLTIEKGIKGGTADAKKVTIQFGSDGATTTNAQTVTIKGNVKGLNYKGAKGNDSLKIIGSLSNSTVDLGEGTNSLTVVNKQSHGTTITNSTIKSTEGGSTNTIIAGNVTSSGKSGNTVIDLSGGGGVVSLGNVSGNTQISTGTGSTTFTAGKFSGPKVSYTSTGHGSFIVGEISNKATVDFGDSTTGSITIGTNGTGGKGKPNGHITDATLKFGSNAVTLIAGGAEATGTDGGTKNMTNVNIEGSNAKSFTLRGTNVSGKSSMNLGGTVSMTLSGSLGGNSSITTGTGSATITVKDILGTSKDTRVNIDVSRASSSGMTVTGDATNFTFTGASGNTTLNFGSVNQSKKGKSFGADFNMTNAAADSQMETQILGKSKNVTYTGGDKGIDGLRPVGEMLNSVLNLGAGKNVVSGTTPGTMAGPLTNTKITDTAGADTFLALSSMNNSGNGSSGVDLKGDKAKVYFVGSGATVTSDVNLNAVDNSLFIDATVGKAGSKKTTNITIGTNADSISLEFWGNSNNLNISDSGKGFVGVKFASGSHTKTNLSMSGTTANTLFIDAEMNGLVAALGNKDNNVDGFNTIHVLSNAKFGAGKDTANITFTGVSVGQNLNSGTNALTNMNVTSSDADFTLTARYVENVSATVATDKKSIFTASTSAKGLTINGGNGGSSGSGALLIGYGYGSHGTSYENLKVTGWGSGGVSVLAKSISGADISANGNITIGSGSDAITTTGTVTLDAGSGGNIDLNVNKFENLVINNARDLELTASDAKGDSLSANITGNFSGSAITSLGTGNFTVGGTATLGASGTTTYGTLNGNFTGKATILGKEITSGGDITFGKSGSGSELGISGSMTNVNVTNNGADAVSVGVANVTEFKGGTIKNGANGTLKIIGKRASGTIISGGQGAVSGDISSDFSGEYIDGKRVSTFGVGGTFTGGADTTVNNTDFIAFTIASKVTIGGGMVRAINLKADAAVNSGKLLVDNQQSGTIYGGGTNTTALISVKTQDSGSTINANGSQVKVETANGSNTIKGSGQLFVKTLNSGSIKMEGNSTLSLETHTGGTVDMASKDNLQGYADGATALKLDSIKIGGASYDFTNSAATTVTFDKAAATGVTFGMAGAKPAVMPTGGTYVES